jgi:hypothetical protein
MPALSRQDPLFGLIYYVLGGWVRTFTYSQPIIPPIFHTVNWLERCLLTRGDSHIPGAFSRHPLLNTTSQPEWQVNYYYTWCSEDPLAHKFMVAVLFLLTALKTIQSLHVSHAHSQHLRTNDRLKRGHLDQYHFVHA